MNNKEIALNYFNGSYNCSQSILATYCESFDIKREQAFRIACPFGGGLAHTGNTCGAVTGALMVIGLKFGTDEKTDINAKEKTYAVSIKFLNDFKERHSTTKCIELIKHDISSEKGMNEARIDKVFSRLCPNYITTAVELLDDMLFS